ncbi:hypothetical protein [Cytobacillus sp. IB215665]|uniref:hypothetical protein n=1 Tax=Cytobacillus sp. IB215665 TaxID=3097357 RepID=UPI002A0FD151|nr:hypothetical protein [Cytobacillus sp. IB215665]MDX8367671.1 hypothetical protein [Cytobacillus sp. IB215665]
MTKISPFSCTHDYKVYWNPIDTNEEPSSAGFIYSSDEEKEMLRQVGSIGVIGQIQLSRIFLNNQKAKLNKLLDLKKVRQHLLQKGNQQIPIYTLGYVGLNNIDRLDRINQFKDFTKDQILQKLVFANLFSEFKKNNSEAKVHEAIDGPYTGIIENNEKMYHVIVVRGNESEIENHFKYEQPKERVLIVVESLSFVTPIIDSVKEYSKQIRVTTDLDMRDGFQNMFYKFFDGSLIKEKELSELKLKN